MSWANYEPVATAPAHMQPMHMQPMQQIKPMMQNKPENPAYSQQPQQQEKKPPQEDQQKSKWADISEYEEIRDWFYIFLGILVTEVILLFLVRYFPEVFGKFVNIWYNRFKLSAVLADVFIIAIGIGLSRYVYTEFIYPKHDWSPLYFTGLTVVIQVLHDILFYMGVIQQVPKGQNAMIDVMKEYASSLGTWTILGDSAMMISSVGLAMIFKGMEAHSTVFLGLLTVYIIPYILETRNDYSTLG
jgi:hypothetical protein